MTKTRIAGLVAAIVLLAWIGSGWLAPGTPVDAVRAQRGPIQEFVDEQAVTRLPETYLVGMRVAGRVEPIALAEGARVRKGQVIARMVATDLELATRQAEAHLDAVRLNQTRGTLTSPVDGVVLKRYTTSEGFLAAGASLLEIGRLDDMEVEADILTLDAVTARVGGRVEIYGPAIGAPRAAGIVRRIYPAGFTKVSSLGVEQQRVKVIVGFEPGQLPRLLTERELGVGYRVRVRIFTAEKANVLTLPRSSLFRSPDGTWQVYQVAGGRARITPVKLGLINDERAEVLEGIAEGDLVIISPESNLTDSQRVSPLVR